MEGRKIYKVEITPEADFVEAPTKKVFVTDFFPSEMDNDKISKKRSSL